MAGPDLTHVCPQCKFKMTLGPANTVLILVKQHEYMSHIATTCPRPQCSHHWLSFLNAEDPVNTRQVVKLIREARWPMRTVSISQYIIDQYEEVAGVTLLKAWQLNPRQEAQIKALAWELEGVVTVQDILDVDIENRLPKEWI